MGAWGPKLYQDDLALDIKEQFVELLRQRKNVAEATDLLCSDYEDVSDDPDDGPVFWFVLADVQWDNEILLPPSPEYKSVWEPVIGIGLITVSVIAIAIVAADDATVVGIADDFLFSPLSEFTRKGLIMVFG